MKKRIGYAILTVILCFAMVFGLAACDSEDKITTADAGRTTAASDGNNSTASNDDSANAPDEDGTQTPHEHTYAEAWSNDETHHWHAATCEHNDEKSDYEEHTWGEGVVTTPATCCSGTMTYTCVCGATKTEEISPVSAHTYSTEWSNNETHHWHAATCEHSDEKDAYAGHTYGADHICTVCAYQVTPTDGLEYTLNSDEMSYSVSDIGTATDTNIVIAATYKNLPITSIGEEAFYNCMRLTSITIPDGVTSIGGRAFQNCTSLSSITIPNSVTSIDDWAFLGCSSLTSVHISDIAAWCNIAFRAYSSNPLSYAYYLYLNGTLVTDLVIPDSVTSIGDWTFSGCRSLTSITISNSVTSIGEDAVRDCWNLTSITLPDSVTSIGEDAFRDCWRLTSITIGNGVTSIGDHAFWDCTSLTGVYISDIAAWCNISFGSYDANPLCYAHNLYWNNSLLTELEIPNTVTRLGNYAFYNCSKLTSVVIPDSVMTIGSSAFSHCSSLTGIAISDSVTSIGEDAFEGCTNLTYTTFDNAKYLGNENTPYLVLIDVIVPSVTSFTMQESTKIIYDDAFSYCSNLTSITIPDGVTSIGFDAFEDCTSLTSITIPDSVTSIGFDAFEGCTSLTSITIGSSVTSIGFDAFEGCTSLTSITIGSSVTSIGSDAFNGCTGLTSVTIPDSVTSIGDGAFCDCTSLTSVTIGNDVTSIGYYAFDGCDKLVEVYNCSALTITKGSSDLGSVGCYALNIYTPTSGESKLHTTEDGYVFYVDETNCYLVAYHGNATDLMLPANYQGQSYEIYQYAFSGCTSLTSITIPDGVTSIGQYAFLNCTNLTTVYYIGTATEWDTIEIDDTNLTSATRYYYSENEPTTSGNYWHYVDGVPTPWEN